MIFGEKFYSILGKMSPWKQSLFALVLAVRQYPNFALWCEVNERKDGKIAFNRAADLLWKFHSDKFNDINLESVLDDLEPFLLDDKKEELSVGDLYSLDASISISAAIYAIILHEGNEAEMASMASVSGVSRLLEQQEDREFSDEELRETPQIDAEVNFQVELMELLDKSKRSPELTSKLKKLAFNDGVSNIGFSLES